MAVSNNFLPKFNISNNLSRDLKNIEIAKQLTTGWYKGKFDYHLREAGFVTMINGEEYYSNIPMLFIQRELFTEGTSGWHIAEWLKLIGMKDEDLKEIQTIANTEGVDGIYQSWKAKEGISSEQFKHNIEKIKELLINIDEVRIDYENQRYKSSVYNTSALRPYNTKESLYGNSLLWATEQLSDSNRWTSDERILTLENIQTKPVQSGFGKAIRFYKAGIDVTSSYNSTIKNAVQSMIMYSGNDFMQRVSSSKTSEVSYNVTTTTYDSITTENYTAVTGTEVFNATIKQSFIDDIDDKYFIKYTVLADTDSQTKSVVTTYSESPTILDGRSELTIITYGAYDILSKTTYANNFWLLMGYIKTLNIFINVKPIVNIGDEFLFYDSGDNNIGAYMKVSEFRKLSIDEIGYYIGEYFDIRITQDNGGFFSSFLGFIAGFLGLIFDGIYSILNIVPLARQTLQIFTLIVNKIFNSDLDERELFDISAQVVVAVLAIYLAPVTGGTSLGLTTGQFAIASLAISMSLSLGIAGSKAKRAETEAEKKAEVEKQRKEELAEVTKQENEQKERERKFKTDSEQSEEEEFQSFLNDPLYKLTKERNKMKSDFESQFKLL